MKRDRLRVRPISCILIALVVTGVAVYTASSIGLFDHLYSAPRRKQAEWRLQLAENTCPPDVHGVVPAIMGPDWFVATLGAETAERLAQGTDLDEQARMQLLQGLMTMLSSGGHWWRFGWDRSEPEYGQFLGAAQSAVARFGAQAHPFLVAGLDSRNVHSQEASCWVILTMFKTQELPTDDLMSDLLLRVRSRTSEETDQPAREACQRALNAISAAEK